MSIGRWISAMTRVPCVNSATRRAPRQCRRLASVPRRSRGPTTSGSASARSRAAPRLCQTMAGIAVTTATGLPACIKAPKERRPPRAILSSGWFGIHSLARPRPPWMGRTAASPIQRRRSSAPTHRVPAPATGSRPVPPGSAIRSRWQYTDNHDGRDRCLCFEATSSSRAPTGTAPAREPYWEPWNCCRVVRVHCHPSNAPRR
jgi:hypothetical protein